MPSKEAEKALQYR